MGLRRAITWRQVVNTGASWPRESNQRLKRPIKRAFKRFSATDHITNERHENDYISLRVSSSLPAKLLFSYFLLLIRPAIMYSCSVYLFWLTAFLPSCFSLFRIVNSFCYTVVLFFAYLSIVNFLSGILICFSLSPVFHLFIYNTCVVLSPAYLILVKFPLCAVALYRSLI